MTIPVNESLTLSVAADKETQRITLRIEVSLRPEEVHRLIQELRAAGTAVDDGTSQIGF